MEQKQSLWLKSVIFLNKLNRSGVILKLDDSEPNFCIAVPSD